MKVQIRDQVSLSTRDKSREGFLQAKAAVTRSTVSEYSRGELGLDGDPSETVGIYRTEETVFHEDTKGTLKLRPVTIGHPDDTVDSANARAYAVGTTGENAVRDDDKLVVGVSIFDEAAISKVESGKDEVSLGYIWDIEEQSGTYDGKDYDYVSTGPMIINHLALVDKGRLGADVRVLDSKPEDEVAKEDADAKTVDEDMEPVSTDGVDGADDSRSDDSASQQDADAKGHQSEGNKRTDDMYVDVNLVMSLFDTLYVEGDSMDESLVPKISEMITNAVSGSGSATKDHKEVAELVAKDVERSVVDRANKRAKLLADARRFLKEDEYDKVSEKSDKDVLVAAVGDTVADPEDKSLEYLRAALDFRIAAADKVDEGRKRAEDQRKSKANDVKGVDFGTGSNDKLAEAYDAYDQHLRGAYLVNGGK